MVKNISWRNLVRKLHVLGFSGPHSGGKHLIMVRENLILHIPNPHRGDISGHLVAQIIRQAGISRDEWEAG